MGTQHLRMLSSQPTAMVGLGCPVARLETIHVRILMTNSASINHIKIALKRGIQAEHTKSYTYLE